MLDQKIFFEFLLSVLYLPSFVLGVFSRLTDNL